jgi:hypothetical protein
MGCECLGANARLFSDDVKGMFTPTEMVFLVKPLGAAGGIKNGVLKLGVLSLSDKSEALSELSEAGVGDAIQKKFKAVTKKDGTSLNESLKNAFHEALDFNMIVVQKEV